MKNRPKFNKYGDLLAGIHKASLSDVIEHVGEGTLQRAILAQRLQRTYDLAVETGQAAPFIIFGDLFSLASQIFRISIYSSDGGFVRHSSGCG